MRKQAFYLVVLISLILGACSTTKFNVKEKVIIKEKPIASQYYQGEQFVHLADMADKLSARGVAPESISKYKDYTLVAMIGAFLGGFIMVSDNLGTILGGGAIVGGSLWLGHIADSHLKKAVEQHNESLGSTRRERGNLSPQLNMAFSF